MTRSPALPSGRAVPSAPGRPAPPASAARPIEHAEIFTVPETGESIRVRCQCHRGVDHEFHRSPEEGDGATR
ncbi:hypothetical protein ROT00_08650 [Agromyces mediolanus]|uniref:hypothetical protein n=1 Tax=Agromyces mediolanus TaxID=41986 RepID=UPI003834BE2E